MSVYDYLTAYCAKAVESCDGQGEDMFVHLPELGLVAFIDYDPL